MRLVQSRTSAAPTSTFFGSHPRRAQVPPNGLESTTATCFPALRHRIATVEAAEPVPITTTSYFTIAPVRAAFCQPSVGALTHSIAAHRAHSPVEDYLDCSVLKPAFSIVFWISA